VQFIHTWCIGSEAVDNHCICQLVDGYVLVLQTTTLIDFCCQRGSELGPQVLKLFLLTIQSTPNEMNINICSGMK